MVEEELLSFGFEQDREEETPGQEAARDRVEALVGPVKKTREVGGAADGWIGSGCGWLRLVGMDPEGKNESGGGADGTGWMGRLGLGLPRYLYQMNLG